MDADGGESGGFERELASGIGLETVLEAAGVELIPGVGNQAAEGDDGGVTVLGAEAGGLRAEFVEVEGAVGVDEMEVGGGFGGGLDDQFAEREAAEVDVGLALVGGVAGDAAAASEVGDAA